MHVKNPTPHRRQNVQRRIWKIERDVAGLHLQWKPEKWKHDRNPRPSDDEWIESLGLGSQGLVLLLPIFLCIILTMLFVGFLIKNLEERMSNH